MKRRLSSIAVHKVLWEIRESHCEVPMGCFGAHLDEYRFIDQSLPKGFFSDRQCSNLSVLDKSVFM